MSKKVQQDILRAF